MREDEELNRQKILNESFAMSNNAERRRGLVKSIIGSVASIPLLSSFASASKSTESGDYRVQNRQVSPGTVRQKVKEVSTDLLDTLATDGLITEPYVTSFPYHRMDHPSALGGIERLQINGDRENILVHKPTSDGGRLTLRLPAGDRDASATYIPKEKEKRIEYYASGRRQVHEQSGKVGTQATCENYCTNHCCDNTGHVCTDDDTGIQEPCPNCWLGDCKTVGYECETGCYYN